MPDPFHIVGTTLEGKYRIDEVVGEGGFGVVYRGHHLSFEQPIAIKCLKVPPHFTPEARRLFLTKFREEGKHLARLGEHPSITRVYDFGFIEGATSVPYLILEWLEGSDLEQLLAKLRTRARPLSETEALQLLRPAIDALALAHGLGIAHRDIKPPNLFWTKGARGHVLKVLDFGIAKAMAEGDTATQVATKTSSGFSAFSPSYGAPEQFRSKKFGATGPWTDVHAIGLILSEIVAGRAALEGEEMIDFYEQCSKETRPTPRALGADVTDAFEALCRKALALAPKERFATAGELLEKVDELLHGAPQLSLEDLAPADEARRGAAATSTPRATVAQAPLDVATVAAAPLDPAASAREVPQPKRPARLALGAAAAIAALGGVVYVSTRAPVEQAGRPPAASSAAAPASLPTSAADEAASAATPTTRATPTVSAPEPAASPSASAAPSASASSSTLAAARPAPRPAPPPPRPLGKCADAGRLCRSGPPGPASPGQDANGCYPLSCCNAAPGYNTFEVCRIDDKCFCRERN